MELKPQLVIVTLYAGNDLYDSYAIIYIQNQAEMLRTTDAAVLQDIQKVEAVELLQDKISKFYNIYIDGTKARANRRLGMKSKNIEKDIKAFDQNTHWVYHDKVLLTILTPQYRFCGLNLEDPRITEGKRISLEAISAMQKRSKQAKIPFIVLFIPTKELAFKDIVYMQTKNITPAYNVLIKNEELLWREAKSFLSRTGIQFFDTLPALRKCLQSDVVPYFSSIDGHPNMEGHRAIAELVHTELKKYNLLPSAK